MTQNPINKIGDFPENKNINQFLFFPQDFEIIDHAVRMCQVGLIGKTRGPWATSLTWVILANIPPEHMQRLFSLLPLDRIASKFIS